MLIPAGNRNASEPTPSLDLGSGICRHSIDNSIDIVVVVDTLGHVRRLLVLVSLFISFIVYVTLRYVTLRYVRLLLFNPLP